MEFAPGFRCLFLPCLAQLLFLQEGKRIRPLSTKIRQNTDLVVMHMTVIDHKGNLVPGLEQGSFQVFEDSVSQPIETFTQEDIPSTIGLVIDNSASMRTKRPDVNAAALAFAKSSNPQDQMFVVNFSDSVGFALPDDTPFTSQPAELQQALSRVLPEGRTALYDGLYYALEHLKEGDRDKKALILISDGGDNASKRTIEGIKGMAMYSNAIIYAIGLFDPNDADRNPKVLKQLAEVTGGEAFFPDSSKDVPAICEKIALNIRRQYMLAYAPLNQKMDGAFRKVQIRVSGTDHGHLNVRTRAGYFAPSASQSSPGGD